MLVLGQPTPQAKWERLKGTWAKSLEDREVYVHPGEVVELKKNPALYVKILDVRSEADFNLFHLGGAQRLDLAEIARPATLNRLLTAPENTVFLVVSNGEQASTQAWRCSRPAASRISISLKGESIIGWRFFLPSPVCWPMGIASRPEPAEQGAYDFRYAVGDQSRAAHPDSSAPSHGWPARGRQGRDRDFRRVTGLNEICPHRLMSRK